MSFRYRFKGFLLYVCAYFADLKLLLLILFLVLIRRYIEFFAIYHQVAARTLGDVVRKLGEKVLPEIIPILEKGLQSTHSDQRQGVCIGLSEIMASTSKDHVCCPLSLHLILKLSFICNIIF